MALSLKEASERLGVDLKTLNKRMLSLQITPEKSPTDGRSKRISDTDFRLLRRGKSAVKVPGTSARKSPDDAVFIYALADPETGKVGYVGQSENPEKRYQSHISSKGYGTRNAWIDDLRQRSLMPTLQILEETTRQNATQAESHWMEYHQDTGAQLHNIQQPQTRAVIGLPTKTASQLAEEWGVHVSAILHAAERANLGKLRGAGYSESEIIRLQMNMSKTFPFDAVERQKMEVVGMEAQLNEMKVLLDVLDAQMDENEKKIQEHDVALGSLQELSDRLVRRINALTLWLQKREVVFQRINKQYNLVCADLKALWFRVFPLDNPEQAGHREGDTPGFLKTVSVMVDEYGLETMKLLQEEEDKTGAWSENILAQVPRLPGSNG